MSYQERLKRHQFLDGVSDPLIARLDSCCTSEVSWEAGATIFKTGTEATACYLIEEGEVTLEVVTAAERRAVIDVLGNGAVLGWSWLYPPYRWRFDARAVAPTTALALAADPLRQAKASDAELGHELMVRFTKVIVDRLQHTRVRLAESLS